MIVQNFDNANATPDVFLREVSPPPSVVGSAIGVIGVVMQASRGPVGVPTLVTSLADFIRQFGGYTSAHAGEGFMFAYNLFKNGASRVKVVRVTDGNEAKATLVQSGSTFRLKQPGTFGNNVTLTVVNNAATGYVDLLFKNGNNESYLYPQVTFTNTADPNYVDTILSASTDGFVEMAAISNSSNPASGTYTFTGGSDGTSVGTALLDSAYVGTNGSGGLSGLVSLEGDDDVELIVCSRANTVVSQAVLTHCALTTVTPRLGIAAPASGTTVAGMATLMGNFNSDRAVMTYPWLQILNPYNNKKEYHAPNAFYAGLLSTLSYHISPSRQAVNGVIGTERALTRADLDTLTNNRVSPISLLSANFMVRNGVNCSSDQAKNNITRRRAVNFFAKTFEAGGQQFVSRPHTPALRNDIKAAFGSLLQQEVNLGKIGQVNGGKPYAVKCDAQNNPDSSVAQSKLVVDIAISLWAPADYILISLDASEAKVITIQ